MKIKLDGNSIKAIEDIVNRGNHAEIQRRKDGCIVMEVKKTIKSNSATTA